MKWNELEKHVMWVWSDHPLGFPIPPEEADFKGQRTSPYARLSLCYQKEGHRLQQQAMVLGAVETLSEEQKKEMKNLLLYWLENQLRKTDTTPNI